MAALNRTILKKDEKCTLFEERFMILGCFRDRGEAYSSVGFGPPLGIGLPSLSCFATWAKNGPLRIGLWWVPGGKIH